MTSKEYEERIFQVIYSIPKGKVTTYGQVASLAGLPGRARLVGRLLKNLPAGTQLPWHRVINSQGRISLDRNSTGYCLQQQKLEQEGIHFSNHKINLRLFCWVP